MKIYIASYYRSYGLGAYDEYEYVIFANTEQEALGLALEAQPLTRTVGWEITEIDSSTQTHLITQNIC
jgi:hypothetical protein